MLENGSPGSWGSLSSFTHIFARTTRICLDVDEILYIIQPLGAARSYTALILEPNQHLMETGSRLCCTFTRACGTVNCNDEGGVAVVAMLFAPESVPQFTSQYYLRAVLRPWAVDVETGIPIV